MFNSNLSDAIDYNKTQEPTRNRFEVREVEVYDDFYNIDTTKFFGIKEIVKVTRNTYLKNTDHFSSEISFYISSKKMSAREYNIGIRSHWSVESMHYVKDVTFGEDASLIRSGNAPTNFSIIRNIAINVLRRQNYLNFPQAIRMLGGNIKKLCCLLE
ncbi:ISAs1 family transposase [Sulfurimonas sp.]|uniref:ISAs1 family transposase n=1 Tax=Sulfurimonas sp. TaxID=2022749 RepID=UPI0019FA07AE|nr:ISAs1 family transposase [Sulfurimonas sp.]MBE0515762.1 ISAs1 family transposase [Sulfurimonas sp.]